MEISPAITGWQITERLWKEELGQRIVHIQRAAELIGGPDVNWFPPEGDGNPRRFYEPLPSGPYKGSATQRDEMERKKKQYYAAIGWDERGIPKTSFLRKLGLDGVEKILTRIR